MKEVVLLHTLLGNMSSKEPRSIDFGEVEVGLIQINIEQMLYSSS
jgi:hypothetical protein